MMLRHCQYPIFRFITTMTTILVCALARRRAASKVIVLINKQVEEKKVMRSSQHGFTNGKSCLTNLIAFYDDMTG